MLTSPFTPLRSVMWVLITAILATGCADGRDELSSGPLVEDRRRSGDTVFVRIEAGSKWTRTPRLDQDLEIGELEGASELTFGSITGLAVDSAGGILVFDAQVPALRYFDAEGSFVRTVGRVGQGPGEYGDAERGLFVLDDGRILLRDMRNRRINLYATDGASLDHLLVPSGLFTEHATLLGEDGLIYVAVLLFQPALGEPMPTPWPMGHLRMTLAGEILDTVPAPQVADNPGERSVWSIHPDGSFVIASPTLFRFEIRAPDRKVTIVELDRELVPYSEEERAEFARRARAEDDEAGIPEFKPSFKRFLFDEAGRIWAQRSMPAESDDGVASTLGPMTALAPNWPFYEPLVFDVFQRDGTYLGAVIFPKNVRPDVLGAHTIHGVRAGAYGEHYVVRYRLAGVDAESF